MRQVFNIGRDQIVQKLFGTRAGNSDQAAVGKKGGRHGITVRFIESISGGVAVGCRGNLKKCSLLFSRSSICRTATRFC